MKDTNRNSRQVVLGVSLVSLAAFVPWLLAAGCGDDASSGADAGCDPGRSWVFDVMVAEQNAGESGFDHLFYPPDTICAPRDVSLYAQEDRVVLFFDWIRGMAIAYLDPSCVADCVDMADFEECLEADCTTPDGTVIEYSYTRQYQVIENQLEPGSETFVEESLTVTPSAGVETWGGIHFVLSKYDADYPEYDTGGYREAQYGADWIGTIHPALPADTSVTGTVTRSWDDSHDQDGWTFVSSALELSVINPGSDAELKSQVSLNGAMVEVFSSPVAACDNDYRYSGWIDGACVGEIDRWSWEILGECGECADIDTDVGAGCEEEAVQPCFDAYGACVGECEGASTDTDTDADAGADTDTETEADSDSSYTACIQECVAGLCDCLITGGCTYYPYLQAMGC